MTDSLLQSLEARLPAYLKDLQALVAIDSHSPYKPGVDAVNDWLAARLAALGFSVERQPQAEFGDNLIGRLHGRGRGRILLLGHSDTVFPPGAAARRPLTIHAGKVMGPGACDMKAGLLTGLYAVEALQASGFDAFERITYLCVSDEESGVRQAVPLIRAESRQADAVLTLEAARENGDIVIARKAVRWYTVEAHGRAAHAGVEPERGRNAILALAQHIVALDRLNGLRPGATLTVGTFHAGLQPSVVADYAAMRLDLRAVSDADMDALEDALHGQLSRPVVAGVRVVATLEAGSVCPAMAHHPGVLALEALAQQAASELGFRVQGSSTGGASDANYAAAEGRPVLDGLGPVGGLDHSPDEYVALESIAPRTALLAKLIMAIARKMETDG
jgi:glutamate carboxypeptidase